MHNAFISMLREIGVCDDDDSESSSSEEFNHVIPTPQCCGHGLFESGGFMVCDTCGKTQTLSPSLAPVARSTDESANLLGYVKRYNPGYTITRKRFYKSSTHFKSHLKRYLGQSGMRVPQDIVDAMGEIDISDPMLYFVVKQKLKEMKRPALYRAVHEIMYRCGAHKPKFTSEFAQICIGQYIDLEIYFSANRQQFGRKSMPSVPMLMDLIFRRLKYKPFYMLPQLKDTELRNKVLEFYKQYDATQLTPFRTIRSRSEPIETFMQDYPSMPVLYKRIQHRFRRSTSAEQ